VRKLQAFSDYFLLAALDPDVHLGLSCYLGIDFIWVVKGNRCCLMFISWRKNLSGKMESSFYPGACLQRANVRGITDLLRVIGTPMHRSLSYFSVVIRS